MIRPATLALLVLTAANRPLVAQQLTVQVVELATTKGDSLGPFGNVVSMLEGEPGILIISDDKTPALHKWAVKSGQVTIFSRRGQGPGEVQVPESLARRPTGGFAVYDLSNGVIFFDRALRYERRFVPQGGFVSNPKNLTILSDSSVIIAGGRLRDPRHLHRYSHKGEWLESFGDPPSGLTTAYSRIQTAGGALRALPSGFLFSVGTPLRVLRFPTNTFATPSVLTEDMGLLPEVTEAKISGPPEPRSQGTPEFLWWHDRSTAVLSLPDGRILNVVTRFYSHESIWNVYSRDGLRLAHGRIPRAYYVWDLLADGSIAASYRDTDTGEHIAVVLRIVVR